MPYQMEQMTQNIIKKSKRILGTSCFSLFFQCLKIEIQGKIKSNCFSDLKLQTEKRVDSGQVNFCSLR